MKTRGFRFDSTHAIILLTIIFLSSLLFLFLSKRNGGRYEFFSSPKKVNIEYYYIEGCPHCVDFDPTWKDISSSLSDVADFKKYEISANTDRARKFGISSAPTVIAVDKQSDMKVSALQTDERSKNGFTTFVKRYA